ncbi:MAG: ankyrin repeat domain-containing protein [Planctomycetota bacterium]|jgi:cytohesin
MRSEWFIVLGPVLAGLALAGTTAAERMRPAKAIQDNKARQDSKKEGWIFDYSAMYGAAQSGDTARVKELLKKDPCLANCSFGGEDKLTPLHWATIRGHMDVMEVLIENGADIEARDRWGATPLLKATDLAVVKLLLRHGADFRVTNHRGYSVLHHAAYEGNMELAKLWIELGVDLEQLYAKGGTPLLCAASRDHNNVVELLLEKRAHIGACDNEGQTALHKAAWGNSVKVMKLLLARGMKTDVIDKAGETPLHEAARVGLRCFDSAVLLLSNGANVNIPDKQGRTALHHAVRDPNERLVRVLLEHGADPNVRDKFNRTPLWESVAVDNGPNIESVKLLLRAGAETDVIPYDAGCTELHQAVAMVRLDLVKLLLAHGADVNAGTVRVRYWLFRARQRGPWNRAPLHIAARALPVMNGRRAYALRRPRPLSKEIIVNGAARVEMVELLLSHGADINAVDTESKAPLDVAREHGNEEIAATLCQHGAKHGRELTPREP